MDTLSAATVGLAAVTFLLALVAAYSVWQTYQIRKKDTERTHKVALLDEVDKSAKECSDILVELTGSSLDIQRNELETLGREANLLEYESTLLTEATEKLRSIEKAANKSQSSLLQNQLNELRKRAHEVHLIRLKDLPSTPSQDRKHKQYSNWAFILAKSAIRFDEAANRLTLTEIREIDVIEKIKRNLSELHSILLSDKPIEWVEIVDILRNSLEASAKTRSVIYQSKLDILK